MVLSGTRKERFCPGRERERKGEIINLTFLTIVYKHLLFLKLFCSRFSTTERAKRATCLLDNGEKR